jgi:phospholipase C
MADPRISRRQVLAGGVGAALALGMSRAKVVRTNGHRLVQAAAATHAAGSDLGAVEHVVFLMHENRSFDHYFGALGGVNGFDAVSPAFAQAWPGGASSTLLPFHLDTQTMSAECTYDLSHTWQAEHDSWNNGAMDQFVSTHVSPGLEGPDRGTLTMGYYDSADLPFYYDLVQNFTICDNYFCSVLGPTHPNRLMQMTGTLDPAGFAGGPILVTNSDPHLKWTCSWDTMPEILTEHNVSWKMYNAHGASYQPDHKSSLLYSNNPMQYFKQYRARASKLHRNAFGYFGPNVADDVFSSSGPNSLAHHVKRNTLPAVSWIFAPLGYDEHPPAPSSLGEWYTAQVLTTLMSNPAVWASTVLFVMYDENDGFFDHVPPPTPPPGAPGEYVTKSPLPASAGGVAGPIGLGVRVPMMVISPFSRGGWVCSDTYDHTSQLQFLAARWGVPVPNVSAWRRSTVGDLTAALPTLSSPNATIPALPATSQNQAILPLSECAGIQLTEANFPTAPYPVPAVQSQPTQGPNTLTPTPT